MASTFTLRLTDDVRARLEQAARDHDPEVSMGFIAHEILDAHLPPRKDTPAPGRSRAKPAKYPPLRRRPKP
jgi:hypothetical protein